MCDADRIEQLKAELESLKQENKRLDANWRTEQKARLETANLVEMYSAVKAERQIKKQEQEIDRLRRALQAIVDRDPTKPGPRAAVVVTTSTLVKIAQQALEEG